MADMTATPLPAGGQAKAPTALPRYSWWDEVPENLKTKTQLGQQGLKPGGPVRARIHYGHGRRERDYGLYEVSEAVAKRGVSSAQRAALEKAQRATRTCKRCRQVKASRTSLLDYDRMSWRESDYYARFDVPNGVCYACVDHCIAEYHRHSRDKAILWARELITSGGFYVLDTETTDLNGEIIEVAVTDASGATVFETLCNPVGAHGAEHIHGISEAEVRAPGVPLFAEVWYPLLALLRGHTVLAYNVRFDRDMVRDGVYRTLRAALPPQPEFPGSDATSEERQAWWAQRGEYSDLKDALDEVAKAWSKTVNWDCIMERYAAFNGDWSDRHGDYRYIALRGGHRAAGDCRAALARLQEMARTPTSEEEAEYWADVEAGVGRWESEGGMVPELARGA